MLDKINKEIFKILYRVMTYHNGQIPIGCVVCSSNKITYGYKKGYGGLCKSCMIYNKEQFPDKVFYYNSYKDLQKLEKLGFIAPDSDDKYHLYSELVKGSNKIFRKL